MDPVTLATVTAAVTVLATECSKGFASQAGKDLWVKIKRLFNWKADPPQFELPVHIAKHLLENQQHLRQVVQLLQADGASGTAHTLVSSITADKVVVANVINTKTFQM